MPSTPNRYDVLDGMRGIAALTVAVFHFTQYQNFTLFYNAPLAVDFFFVLSGFVIAHSYGSRLFKSMGIGEYLSKRIIRLYPLFALGILVGMPSLIALEQAGKAVFSHDSLVTCTALHTLFLPCFSMFGISNMGASNSAWGTIFPANPASWSLFFEMTAGAAFPLLCRLTTKSLVVLVAACWIAFVASGLWLGSWHGSYSLFLDAGWGIGNFWIGFARTFFSFGCGILIYRLRDPEYSLSSARPWMLYLVLALAVAFPLSIKGFYHAFAITLFVPLAVLAGASTHAKPGLSAKAAQWLGRLSYPLYCLHMPIGRVVFLIGEHYNIPSPATAGLALALSFILSWFAVAFIDEPIRAWLSRSLSAFIAARSRRSAHASLQNVLDSASGAESSPQASDDQRKRSL